MENCTRYRLQVIEERGGEAVPDGNTVNLSLGAHSIELRQNTPNFV